MNAKTIESISFKYLFNGMFYETCRCWERRWSHTRLTLYDHL